MDENAHLIYEDTAFTISAISYLFYRDELDMTASTLMNFLCLERENIPQWDYENAQILLNGILGNFSKYFEIHTELKSKLKEYNLLETSKKVNLMNKLSLKKIFARSKNKIKSIGEITTLEYSSMKEDLREVILLDYIGSENLEGLNILAAFENLKNKEYKTGILSGTLVVIPADAKEALTEFFDGSKNITITDYEENYLKVEAKGNFNLVLIITELFYRGYINVLIGTQALLGEGWDSPCVNCLIIASVVGSFMLSNQMRGRAIRVDKKNPQKTANIWHLVSLANSKKCYADFYDLDYECDLELMYNRFKTFEGISFVDNTIQNGIDRLGIPYGDINDKNEVFARRAASREIMKSMWSQIFEKSVITEKNYVSQVYNVIKSEKVKMPVLFVNNQDNWCFKKFLIPWFMHYKTERMQKHTELLIDGILSTLCDLSVIKTPKFKIRVKKFVSSDFTPYVTLTDCSNYERECFISTFEELYSSPENQRYIMRHEDKYLTVPEIIGTNKKNAKLFAKYLEPYFGYLDVVYTRTLNGRKELLKAKYNLLNDTSIQTKRIWL